MTGLLQLVGLVTLAFFASGALGNARRVPALAGLFVLLGVLLGPLGLALVDDEVRALWEPLASLAATWLCLLFGIRLRLGGLSRAGIGGLAAAVAEASATFAALAFGLWWVGHRLELAVPFPLAAALALVGAASSQATVRFARSRLGARGPLTNWLERLTGVDDLPSLTGVLGLALLVAPVRAPAVLIDHPGALTAATVGLGLLLAAAFLLAAGPDPGPDRAWVVLLGCLFLGAGVSAQLGLPETVVGLVAGLTLGRVGHQRLLTAIVSTTEQPVTLLLLVLIGARITLPPPLVWLALLAIALRVGAKLLAGLALGLRAGDRPAAPDLGLGLLGFGGLALASATQLELSYGGTLGEAALVVAAVQAVAFDLGAPLAIGLLLSGRGEARSARERAASSAGLAAAVESGQGAGLSDG